MSTLHFNQQAQQAPCFILLSTLGVLEIKGADTQSFLQGQLTCDVKAASWQHWLAGGYCDPKGKLWSTFRMVGDAERILLFMAQESIAATLTNLKKYAVFSKVSITDVTSEQPLYGYWGKQAAAELGFTDAPSVQHSSSEQNGEKLLLQITDDLVLIRGEHDTQNAHLMPADWWHAAMLEHGWVDVPATKAAEYIPQMLNLDGNHGVNYKKGCYIGQEIVARMHYKGQNKRVTHCFVGHCAQLPETGQLVEKKVGENWRRSGAVLSAVRYHNNVVALFAVGPIDLEPTDLFRMQGQDDSQFTLCPDTQKMES